MGGGLAAGLERQKPADGDHEPIGARTDRRLDAERHFRTQREPATRGVLLEWVGTNMGRTDHKKDRRRVRKFLGR